MSTTHTKTQRKCPSCGSNLLLRQDMVSPDEGIDRTDVMLVCSNEACAEPARHLRTEHPVATERHQHA